MKNKIDVPIWEKVTLSIQEAAAYSGIGEKKIRLLCHDANFAIHIGNHIRIKRKKLEDYLLESDYI